MEQRWLLLLIVVLGSLWNTVVPEGKDSYAQGNLAVVFDASAAKSGEDHPLKADVPHLWCQARSHQTEQLLPIKEAHFVRAIDNKIFPAIIRNDTRAILEFGSVSVLNVGKYRCEITTTDDQFVWGWLFVNMRPVFHTNYSKTLETVGDDYFHVKAPILRVTEGETVTLNCPVVGFPLPTIKWLKDGVLVPSTEQITFLENELQIAKVDFDDEGVYSCIAQNSFPVEVDEEVMTWESRLDREVKVKGSYRWVYPLALIISMLLLLFTIIYACSAFNRYKTYNVEKRERRKKRQTSIACNDNMTQKQPILGFNKNEME